MQIWPFDLSRRKALLDRPASLLRSLPGALAVSMLLAGTQAALADEFPNRPVRAVTPIAPGSGGDLSLRFIAERLSTALGQPVLVENKPGADTYLATQSVLASPADGYTMLLTSPALVTIPLMTPAAKYDAMRDFRIIAMLTRGPAVFVTGAQSRFGSFAQLVNEARAKPGSVSLAIYGNSYRVGAALLALQGGPEFNTVSYKGVSQATSDAIGGAVDVALVDAGAALPMIRGGQMRALALATTARMPELPGVPTVRESGFPDFDLYIWTGLAVRSNTPEAAVQRLERELDVILKSPEFGAYALKRSPGGEVLAITGAEARNTYAREAERYRKAVAQLIRRPK
ncbi:tripartite tricarboxylate transporter substrate binding protein [Cupriavidus alkaliphilus]|uniref:tripartite tricarboxylate transporter substrate binding protein n=1 Tax=Cupriavidus alkaliphilus TaxID=942866 RepID=UPI00160A3207|nr:tripartite tricarboxylate transporter substrate binding protein [Cupriavidus alkaliphilus]MBB2919333.1 tripartite-type tricarboxylate transporter receptor subunit TctC [Cupriavidus alkaliphilus]